MTFDPVTTKVYWTYWHSVKDTDGRRSSGVRYNTSRWHAFTSKTFVEVNYRAICGREVQIETDVWVDVMGDDPLEVPEYFSLPNLCSRCFGMVK